MTDGLVLSLKGDAELVRALLALPDAVFRRVLARAIGQSARPVIAEARQRVSKRTTALQRSLGVRIKRYPRKGIMTAVIGARSGYTFAPGATGNEGDGKRINPGNYSHLVEKGHRIVRPRSLRTYVNKFGLLRRKKGTGSTAGFVRARPFLEPALEGRQADVIARLKAELAIGVEREARRAASRKAAA